jgi:hypothetical protein
MSQAEVHRAQLVQISVEEREVERSALVEKAKVMVAEAVQEAQRLAELEKEDALGKAEVAFDKRMAAKMVELLENNKVKTAQALEAAKKQAKKEHDALSERIRAEMHQLVKTYERAIADANQRRVLAEQRAEGYASELAVGRAKDEKQVLLVDSLRKDVAKYRLRLALLFARSISLLNNANKEANRFQTFGNSVQAKLRAAENKVAELLRVKVEVLGIVEAHRDDIISQVCLPITPVLDPCTHCLSNSLQHKDRVVTLKDAIYSLYEERTRKHAVKDKLKKDVRVCRAGAISFRKSCHGNVQIALLEGSITATEREIREIANLSAIRDGGVDMEISKKKRRLNADLDSLVDRMQVKREEFMVLDDA